MILVGKEHTLAYVMFQLQCLGRFLGKAGRDPSVAKSNWLYVDIIRFFFISMRYIL